MRPTDCLHECYSFTFYAPVTLEELMPCACANQIAPIITKHSICFIRIINTEKKNKVHLDPGCGQLKKYMLHLTCGRPCRGRGWRGELDGYRFLSVEFDD